MKKFLFLTAFVLGLVACGNKQAETQNTVTENAKLADCDITINGIHFTKSINGAEKLVTDSAGIITLRANPNADFFIDPNEKISQDDAGILLTEVDNTKPFTFKGKVTSGFLTEGGLYNAATFNSSDASSTVLQPVNRDLSSRSRSRLPWWSYRCICKHLWKKVPHLRKCRQG